MNISESIEEIIEKHDKTKLTYIFGVIPLFVLVVLLFIYENQTIRTEKKYEITVNVNSTTAKLYKKDAFRHEKLKKADIITSIELGKKVEFLDSINSKWYKVLYYGDTGLIKTKDCFLEQKLLSEEKISRFSTEKNSLFYSYGVLIILMITLIIYLDKIDKKRKKTVLFYEENENLKNYNLIYDEVKLILEKNFIWLIQSEETNHDLKRNAGASTSIKRTEIYLKQNIFPYENVECNINIPGIIINETKYCFYPDVLLKINGMNIEIIEYKNIDINKNQSRFIESDKKSENFTVQGYTYQYVNKDGTPDKRHAYNPTYPICLYSNYEITYNNSTLFKIMCSNAKLCKFDPSISEENNDKDGNQVDKKEFYNLIDDLKIQLNTIYSNLNESADLKEFLNKHSEGSSLGSFETILQYCFLFDISKVYNMMLEKFGENKFHKLVLITLSSSLMGENSKIINDLSYDSLIIMQDGDKLNDVIENFSGFGKKNNPINISLNDKKEKQIFSLPSILKLSNSDYSDNYCTFLYRIATILAKSDNLITNEEEELLKSIYKILNPKNAVKSNKEKIEKSSKMPTIEEAIKELDNLIGLDDVKNEVNSLVNFVNFQKEREKHGLKQNDISYHCVFTGAPGTGKTTVARILATIFRSLEVIDKGHLIETDRTGMIAEYVGQTAVKVDKLVNDALGGVLFIDEAYSLSTGSSEDFGKEAIAALLKRMEDNRDNLIVIVAGYTDKMKDFIDMNPGLKSRFNRYIQFDDYSPSELVSIFKKMCTGSDYTLKSDAEELLVKEFTSVYNSRDESFGNGRYVRNMFEKTIESLSNRISKSEKITKELLTTIEKEDLHFL
jgi:SpoVK/Ycf46/Vps4 family AAA+-type ATPase